MITLALVVVLSQAAPQCVSLNGSRTCGYSCVENGATARCAQTPAGICTKTGSAVACFDPPTWLAAIKAEFPKPTCLSDGGNLACGYDCKREGGQVACAQTPRGICFARYGRLTCMDPPPSVYATLGEQTAKPTCKAQDGVVACGYQCLAGNGVIECTTTPWGTCAEFGGVPDCFDPPKEVICAMGKDTPKPECVNASGRVVCGYHCVTAGTTVGCALTPNGSCDTKGSGGPTCFDPPVRGGTAACLESLLPPPSSP